VLGYYNIAGNLAQGLGSLLGGQIIVYCVTSLSYSEKQAFAYLLRIYATLGAFMCIGYFFMSNDAVEANHSEQRKEAICPEN
jgi:hypothetical protein